MNQQQNPTNGQLMADLVRQKIALSSPKWLIPTGIAAVVSVAAVTTNPMIPLATGMTLAYYGYRKLRGNGQTIEKSYTDPRVLFDWLDKEDQQVCGQFAALYPPDLAMGQTAVKPQGKKEDGSSNQKQQPQGKKEEKKGGESSKKQDEQVDLIGYLASQLHLLVSATSGSGKTHLLTALLIHLIKRGDTVVMTDPKGHQWGPLTEFVYVRPSLNKYLEIFATLSSEMSKRGQKAAQGKVIDKHIWFVFDEWFLARNTLSALDPKGDEYGVSPSDIERALTEAIAAGRSLGVHVVIVSQSHQLGDLSIKPSGKNSFSSALRDSICTIGLGCKWTPGPNGEKLEGNSKSIVGMLNDSHLIKNKNAKEDCLKQYQALLAKDSVNRMYMLHGSQTRVASTPNIKVPAITK